MAPPQNFVQLLATLRDESELGHRYHEPGGPMERSYAEILHEAGRLARGLRERGMAPGDRVGLILATPISFVPAFLGCLWGGFVPVPLYPPSSLGGIEAWLENTGRMLDLAGARLVLSSTPLMTAAPVLQGSVPSLETVEVPAAIVAAEPGPPATVQGEDLAFIQFTSGSTARPKGVQVTHRGLWHNARSIMVDGLAAGPGDRGVTWLPLYHDMGLVGFVLAPLITRTPVTFLRTMAFLRRPLLWLETLAAEAGTISFAPNFAFSLALKKAPRSEPVDLSTVRILGCGAEPIQPRVLEAFQQRFGSWGLRPEAVLPCYGMAEATLAVSFDRRDAPYQVDTIDPDRYHRESIATPVPEGHSFVSCGSPLPGMAVSIVGIDGSPLPDRHIGEVVVEGDSVAAGYWQQPEESARVFAERRVHTGDLGYLAEGRLFITGRSKDLIILHGRNYDPSPIENAAALVEGVREGSVVAFSITGERREELVVTAEVRGEHTQEIELAIRRAITESHGIGVDRVVLLPPRTLPKTTSGKLQRSRTRMRYLEGTLGG